MTRRLLPALATVAIAPAAFAQSAADRADIELGVAVHGTLDTSDETCSRGGLADSYVITGAAGTTIQADLQSDVFDTYLILRGPDGAELAMDDDGGDGTDSRLHFTLPSDGLYEVLATSYSSGATGPYSLQVEEYHPVPLQPSTMALGEAADGRLEEGDAVMQSHGYVDAYDLEVGVGVDIEIVMNSRDFDTYLHLIGPTGERLTSDDDGAGSGTDSRIQYTTQAAGRFRVLATSYGGYAQGSYTIRSAEGFGQTNTAVELTLDEQVTGTFEGSSVDEFAPYDEFDEFGGYGEYAYGGQNDEGDRYTIELDAGLQVVFDMQSEAVDSYLRLLGPEGYDVSADDDSGDGLNARLVYMIQQAGTYTVVASALSGGAGQYTLVATTEEPAEVEAIELTYGEGVSGRLESGDARGLSGGGYIDPYTFEGEAGERVDITVSNNDGMMPNIRVLSPLGEEFGYMSRGYDGGFAGLVLPYTGDYSLLVTSYDSNPYAYTVTVRDASAPAETETLPIEAGTPVNSAFDTGDVITPLRGTYEENYLLVVDEPGLYIISMTSEVIDGYLELWSDGVSIAQNDDSVGLNPAIRQFLPTGEYRIVATQYSMAMGPFVLEVEQAEQEPLNVEYVSAGDHIAGHISNGDTTSLHIGSPADYYRMEVGAGQSFTITINSETIDPVVAVLDEFGEQIAFNDDSGDGSLNSRAVVTSPASGVITIIAGGYDQREGTYEMHIFEGVVEAGVGPVQ